MAWLAHILRVQEQPSWMQGYTITPKSHLYDYMSMNKALCIKGSKPPPNITITQGFKHE